MRLIASVNHYLATTDDNGLQIHQYMHSTINGGGMSIQMETDYPWDGTIKLTIAEAKDGESTLSLRLPEWCVDATLTINDKAQTISAKSGYIKLRRVWHSGDKIILSLSMLPRMVQAHPRVSVVRGSVAIERGPLVYCLEAVDQPDSVDLMDVRMDVDSHLNVIRVDDLVNGAMVIDASGHMPDMQPWQDRLYAPLTQTDNTPGKSVPLRFVPYFLWANRTLGPMRVWIPILTQSEVLHRSDVGLFTRESPRCFFCGKK